MSKCIKCGGEELILTASGYVCKNCGTGASVGHNVRIVPVSRTWTEEEIKELVKKTIKEMPIKDLLGGKE